MRKANGKLPHYSPQDVLCPKYFIMSGNKNNTALSPGQMLDHQRVLRIPRLDMKKAINRIGTWNVRSLFGTGKLDNAIKEMQRLNIDILGISESRWPNSGICDRQGTTFYYSGSSDQTHLNGVGFLITEEVKRSVRNIVACSDRIILLQIHAKPTNLNLVQVYAPTADKPDVEIEAFYEQVHEVLSLLKSDEITIVMGDLNAKVGKEGVNGVTGDFGLGEKNERGDLLIQFCKEEKLVIKNTYYKLPPRRLYTWRSPQDNHNHIIRNQIDFIMINHRYQNSITRVAAYPGADVGSDHNPIIANFKLHLKIIRKRKAHRKYDVQKLNKTGIKENMKLELNRLCNANDPGNKDNPDDIWNNIKENLQDACETVLGQQERIKIRPWMSDEILDTMEERRRAKLSQESERYAELHRTIKRKCKEAREQWIIAECEEAERLHELHDSVNFHRKIKQITGSIKGSPIPSLRNENGELILNPDDLCNEWKQYAETLFHDQRNIHDLFSSTEQLSGPDILESEVQQAIRNMKNRKSPGHDNIHAEVLKTLDTKILTHLCNKIYETGKIPSDWLKSTFVPIPKKNAPRNCGDYRLISLMSHALKVFLRVIHARIYSKCEAMSGETQFGFIKGLGTREALFSMKLLVQKCYDQRRDVFICFIDYQKAFDNVKHDLLLARLQEIGIDSRDIRVIQSLYLQQTAEVRVNSEITTDTFCISKGVRQGCILSPILFNIYVEKIFELALQEDKRGIKVNGIPINNIKYADDTALLAHSPEDLQQLVDRVNQVGKQFGLTINSSKTKVMAITRQPVNYVIRVDGRSLDQVSRFVYLGATLNQKWDCDEEVKIRIGQAKTTFMKLKNLMLARTIPMALRLRVVKCYVWPILLYGAETWSIKVRTLNRIEAFEMWTLRRLLRIPWTARKTNEEVLRMAEVQRELLEIVKVRKISYLGHILRGARYSIPKLILQGKIEGKRGPGRKQHSWLRNIRDWCGVRDAATLFRQAEDGTLQMTQVYD